MSRMRKAIYLAATGFLTSTAVSAAFWQTRRYQESQRRWKVIGEELSLSNPPLLSDLKPQELHALKYVSVSGDITDNYILISRARESRMGFLVVRAIFSEKDGKSILAVEGWMPEEYEEIYEREQKQQSRKGQCLKGILREKEKTDYLHQKMKSSDIQKFNINTFIDVEKAVRQLHLDSENMESQYYVQILKEQEQTGDSPHYPYQYSVDNFQLPYLTPDKHRAYAIFWTLTSMVGCSAIYKVLKMKK